MKTIKIIRDCKGYLANTTYNVKILQYGVVGGFDRYPNDTMEGAIEWSALCEFKDGKVAHFIIGYEMEIIGNVLYEQY